MALPDFQGHSCDSWPFGETEIKPLLSRRLYINVVVGRKRQNVNTFKSTEIKFSDTVSATKKGERGL